MIRLEKWKSRNDRKLEKWFDSLYAVDELNSFAGFAFNHPEVVYPVFSEKDFKLEASGMKHPFIDRRTCVGNDSHIKGWKDFQVITGANMAGKSTYLRTVGINLVLAMTGGPVLAKSFVFKPVDLFTSITTSDSLQDGESYFFAELKRLKQMIDLLENGNKMFIILDEILRGTNSADKRKGSKSLISQLVRLGASGFIATHDLALGELKKEFPEHVENKRFEVEIINDELYFDYKLKEGISQNLNATFLMKKMGITVE
jgi:DNA mismatch repair ATPase MutS